MTVGSKIGGTDSQTVTCSVSSGWIDLALAVAGVTVANNQFMPFFL